ncbi:hypothetical protein C1Y63_01295 [Corynebacterium sp. 13CS0277]|uniref:DUF6882 domain-containing protein n=1 Tax=Corynebacterium sp. 13CS0277 TaxID=2071994 RepID=UPI000D02F962|nr:DUF6882 domain-containing protein [Corynebacterium sp. 13CS0277]PRQ12455.1 hypothetical protein C1Y63_01295 [Corynebacterium sp. 13CS0277]
MSTTVSLSDIAADGALDQALRAADLYRRLGVDRGIDPHIDYGEPTGEAADPLAAPLVRRLDVRLSGHDETLTLRGEVIGTVVGDTFTWAVTPEVPAALNLDEDARQALAGSTELTTAFTGAVRTLYGNGLLLFAAHEDPLRLPEPMVATADAVYVDLPAIEGVSAAEAFAAAELGGLDERRALLGYAAFHSLGVKDIPGGLAFTDGSEVAFTTALAAAHDVAQPTTAAQPATATQPAAPREIPPIALTVSIETPLTAPAAAVAVPEETPAPAVETAPAAPEETPSPAAETAPAAPEETPAPAVESTPEETPAPAVDTTPASGEEVTAFDQLVLDNLYDASLGQVLLSRRWPAGTVTLDLGRGQAHITTPQGTVIVGALPIATIGPAGWLWAWQDPNLPAPAQQAAAPIRAFGEEHQEPRLLGAPAEEADVYAAVTAAKALLGRPASIRVPVAPQVEAIALITHPDLAPGPIDAATLWDVIHTAHPAPAGLAAKEAMRVFLTRHHVPFTDTGDALELVLGPHRVALQADGTPARLRMDDL